jgi:hypothetical protein
MTAVDDGSTAGGGTATLRGDPPGFVSRTIYNASTEQYEEMLVPLRDAYEEAVKRLEIAESDRTLAAQRYELEDMELQRTSWRDSVERADAFQRSITTLFESTLRSARNTYRLLTAMSVALFSTGLALFVFAAVYASLADAKAYSLVFAGLGASSFVALFIVRPYEDAQIALSNMIQGEMAFMAFFEQIRMWANYPWAAGGLDADRVEKASRNLHRRTAEAMDDFERYIETRAAGGSGNGAG